MGWAASASRRRNAPLSGCHDLRSRRATLCNPSLSACIWPRQSFTCTATRRLSGLCSKALLAISGHSVFRTPRALSNWCLGLRIGPPFGALTVETGTYADQFLTSVASASSQPTAPESPKRLLWKISLTFVAKNLAIVEDSRECSHNRLKW